MKEYDTVLTESDFALIPVNVILDKYKYFIIKEVQASLIHTSFLLDRYELTDLIQQANMSLVYTLPKDGVRKHQIYTYIHNSVRATINRLKEYERAEMRDIYVTYFLSDQTTVSDDVEDESTADFESNVDSPEDVLIQKETINGIFNHLDDFGKKLFHELIDPSGDFCTFVEKKRRSKKDRDVGLAYQIVRDKLYAEYFGVSKYKVYNTLVFIEASLKNCLGQ